VKKDVIETKSAPAAIGPYSQAVRAGGLLFVSGQLPIDPPTGKFAGEGVVEQAEQCLKNVKGILEAAGCSLEGVLKTTVFLKDMRDFEEMNKVYSRFFSGEYPARCCVEVSRLPRDARIEIEVVALCADA